MFLEFNHVMTSSDTHSCTLLSAAMGAKAWIGLMFSLERENRAYNNGTV